MSLDLINNFKFVDQAFYALVKYTSTKVGNREKLMKATQYRYNRLFQRVFIALRAGIRMEKLRLKFLRWKKYCSTLWKFRSQRIKTHLLQKLSEYFNYLHQNVNFSQNNRLLIKSITEIRQSKLLSRGWLHLVKNTKIKKSQHKIVVMRSRRIINQYLKIWIDQLIKYQVHKGIVNMLDQWSQNRKLYVYFQRLKYGCEISKWDKNIYKLKSKIFRTWKKETIEQKNNRESKIVFIHSQNILRQSFEFLKQETIDSQRMKLAKDFSIYKIFEAWKTIVHTVKLNIFNLEIKGQQLRQKHNINLKRIYLQQFQHKYQQNVLERKFYIVLEKKIEVKQRSRMKRAVFNSLKFNRIVIQSVQNKKIQIKKIFFGVLKNLILRKLNILQRIEKFQKQRQNHLIKEHFEVFRLLFQKKIQQLTIAEQFYMSKLSRYYFYAWIASVVEEFQKKNYLAEQFYIQRRTIFIFQEWRNVIYSRFQHKMILQSIEDYRNRIKAKRKLVLYKRVFAYLKSLLLKRKYFMKLLHLSFYSWKFQSKLSKIKE